MAARDKQMVLENFTCSICRDVYTDPVTIPCGNNHIVCRQCVQHVLKEDEPMCPVCRSKLKSRRIKNQDSVAEQMRTTNIPCYGCNMKVLVSEMNQHIAGCGRIDRNINYFKPVKETTQRIPKNLPNRSTFKCPYCGLKNLDTTALRTHCNDQHVGSSNPVVCPVCASMPWGNKNQTSVDFMHHLNIRHKFEYDTYVDYGQDDNAMLLAAMQASLENS